MSNKLKFGHAPSHIRDAACDSIHAFLAWNGVGPEPTVECEIGYEPHRISISKACGLVWNCSDVVPGDIFDQLQFELSNDEPAIKRRTYGACARAVVSYLKGRKAMAV
jgi:hypothetical protein